MIGLFAALCAIFCTLCATTVEGVRSLPRGRARKLLQPVLGNDAEAVAARVDEPLAAWSTAATVWAFTALALAEWHCLQTEFHSPAILLSLVLVAVACRYLLPPLLQRPLDENRLNHLIAPVRFLGAMGLPARTWRGWFVRPPERDPSDATVEAAEAHLEEEIRSMVTAGHREGLLENTEREMIESVIDLADAQITEIMTPRTEMVTIQVDTGWDELVRAACESGHSRIPIHGKSRDEIVGVLHIKDLLVELAQKRPGRRPLRTLLRRPFFVPETKPVNEMLEEFQRGRTHVAIVLDEYGGVSGLVTIEDVLEEIVGEIADEHDDALVDGIKQLDENVWEAHARVHISDCNERLGVELPTDEEAFDTLAGLVFHQLGRIPLVGETLETAGVRIKILDANRRRIDRLLIEKPTTPSTETAPQQTE